jgi:hypothetical protein
MKKLLSEGRTNAKTAKNLRKSLILYLAPFDQNSKGVNVCGMATEGCVKGCLFRAGLASIYKTINEARVARTEYMLRDRRTFINQIIDEINRKAKRTEGELAVRLNGTSDLKLVEMAIATGRTIAPNVIFYDYSKFPHKVGNRTLSSGHRYFVTFSRSEENEPLVIDHLKSGGVAAVVFIKVPKTWNGFPVIDGDERDDLMLDVSGGVVLGLKAKGDAKKDDTGFVVRNVANQA